MIEICFINRLKDICLAIPVIRTLEGFNYLVGPVNDIGDIGIAPPVSLGRVVGLTLDSYRCNVPDADVDMESINLSMRKYGYPSYKSFFAKSLQMSVERIGDHIELVPYARAKGRGEIGATPMDIKFISSLDLEDLGLSIKECILQCK